VPDARAKLGVENLQAELDDEQWLLIADPFARRAKAYP
jgi:hypothetical protein